jgi:membrane-associated protease RseP (regulator of RpoE activity)
VHLLGNEPKTSAGTAPALPEERPSSIIGITKMGSDSAKDGLESTLAFLLTINIALGVFNLIPLLPFDGGHIAIATYERIRELRRPKGERYQADIAKMLPLVYGVFAVLLMLMVSAAFLDLTRA